MCWLETPTSEPALAESCVAERPVSADLTDALAGLGNVAARSGRSCLGRDKGRSGWIGADRVRLPPGCDPSLPDHNPSQTTPMRSRLTRLPRRSRRASRQTSLPGGATSTPMPCLTDGAFRHDPDACLLLQALAICTMPDVADTNRDARKRMPLLAIQRSNGARSLKRRQLAGRAQDRPSDAGSGCSPAPAAGPGRSPQPATRQ
jgi:hypothetical protein